MLAHDIQCTANGPWPELSCYHLLSFTLFVLLGDCECNYLWSATLHCCQSSTEQLLSVLSSCPSICQLHMTANSPNMATVHIYTLLGGHWTPLLHVNAQKNLDLPVYLAALSKYFAIILCDSAAQWQADFLNERCFFQVEKSIQDCDSTFIQQWTSSQAKRVSGTRWRGSLDWERHGLQINKATADRQSLSLRLTLSRCVEKKLIHTSTPMWCFVY